MTVEAEGGSMTHRTKWWSLPIAVVVFAMLAAACSDVQEDPGDGAGAGAAAGADCGSDPVTIAVNPWTGSAVNANVAKVLLEQQLGCTVELVDIDESAQFPAMSTGDLDATIEIWPSGHAEDKAKYIDGDQGVVDAGELGVVGKIGWYIPTYMLDDHPELATWEGLNANADLFATSATAPKGQMLDGDPSFVSYDEEIIKNLGLDYELVVAGTETAELAQVKKAYANEEPILFYFYTPHWANQKYDFTEVKLPAYTDACGKAAADSTGGVDCDYPEDVLYKAFNEDLQTKAPAAFDLLTAMTYDNATQEQIALDIDVNGMDPEAAAQKWVDANPDVWQAWLPASS
jgi:glycine betaine/proline transport system substrate-binding protein